MSKELPEGLRPKPVPMTDEAQLDGSISALQEAVKMGKSWMLAVCEPDGTVMSMGQYTEKRACFLALSAMQAWADTAELKGNKQTAQLLEELFRKLGVSKEYLSGGVVPERRGARR